MSTERIRALEIHQENEAADMAEVNQRLARVEAELHQINGKLDKQKGFIAGAMFILVPLWGAIVAGAAWLWDKIVEGTIP